METKIKNLRKQVLEVLKNTPRSRDSDQYLTLCIWNRYYPQYIHEIVMRQNGGEPKKVKLVSLSDIMLLPREDNVKRLRATIQNEDHLYLPTTLEVAKKRKIAEEVWRKYLVIG
jgi:hypothetical protein